MEEKKESRIKVEDLREQEETLTPEESKEVQGGAMLLPAVQKVREAASTSQTSTEGNLVQGNLIGTD